MADMYIKNFDDRSKKPGRMIPFFIVVAILIGAGWWWLGRSDESEISETKLQDEVIQPSASVYVPKTQSSKPAVSTTQVSSQTAPQASIDARRMFNRAQEKVSAGDLKEASALLEKVINETRDLSLRNNALRVQGRVNVQLFFSEVPTLEKTSYVVQPGDSLDRIARKNKTTVDLIRKLNQIEGNLIYPGQRLMVPSAPFVVKVDKTDRQLELVIGGKRFKRYSVGVGRHGKTPIGIFHTVVHQKEPDWTPPTGGIVPFGDPRNVLGTRWMSFQDDARPDLKGFGIHGTSDRESIGGETSNGCIRMLNEDVEEVFLFLPRGTQVIINE
ncbi:MAG: L,D-transpeptidase family protein [Kiritimatiellaceae bacterium]|nr:L,D-transpeptidase family protein [Kiritimatiellaceae bacterium]